MILPHGLLVGKTTAKIVVVSAAGIVTFVVSPEFFNTVAVGIGALIVAAAAVIGLVIHAVIDSKQYKQNARIAADVAAAAKAQAEATLAQTAEIAKIYAQGHEIKVSMDGRMDELLRVNRLQAGQEGENKERQRADAAAAMTDAGVAHDSKIVQEVSNAIVERAGEAIDKAAQSMPSAKPRS